MNANHKVHLGDHVYAQIEDEAILLTTEGAKDALGNVIVSNAIYLEPETACALQRYLLARKIAKKLDF